MTTEQWFDKAMIYFDGNMTAEEAQLFENETAENEEFTQLKRLWKNTDEEGAIFEQNKESAEAFIATHRKLKAEFINEAAERSPNSSDEIYLPKRKAKFSAWQWMAVAAAITGIIFMAEFFMHTATDNRLAVQQKVVSGASGNQLKKDSSANLANENQDSQNKLHQPPNASSSYEKLYADNFEPDEVPEDQSGPLDNAFFYYASGEYRKAISAIDSADKKIVTRGSNSFTPLTNFYALYYKALSLMSLGKTRSATFVLQRAIPNSPSEILKMKAQWYLALAFVEQGQISSANQILQSLTDNPAAGSYKNKAENLLTALKR
jgi:hypothetical protein